MTRNKGQESLIFNISTPRNSMKFSKWLESNWHWNPTGIAGVTILPNFEANLTFREVALPLVNMQQNTTCNILWPFFKLPFLVLTPCGLRIARKSRQLTWQRNLHDSIHRPTSGNLLIIPRPDVGIEWFYYVGWGTPKFKKSRRYIGTWEMSLWWVLSWRV